MLKNFRLVSDGGVGLWGVGVNLVWHKMMSWMKKIDGRGQSWGSGKIATREVIVA